MKARKEDNMESKKVAMTLRSHKGLAIAKVYIFSGSQFLETVDELPI